MTKPERDLRLEAADLKDAVNDLTAAVSEQAAKGKANRALILTLAFFFALGVALGIVVWRVALSAQHANSTANRNFQTQVITCEAGNDARQGNKALWDYIIKLSRKANPHPTPVEKKQLDDIERIVNSTFAPRDCAHLSQSTAPTTPPPSSASSTTPLHK